MRDDGNGLDRAVGLVVAFTGNGDGKGGGLLRREDLPQDRFGKASGFRAVVRVGAPAAELAVLRVFRDEGPGPRDREALRA